MAAETGLVVKELRPLRDGAARLADDLRRQRRRVEVRRPRRARAEDPERADHHDRKDDDRNRPGPSPRAPLTLVREEGRGEEETSDEHRREEDDRRLEARRREREDGEVPEEIPVRTWVGRDEARIGGRADLRRTDEDCEDEDTERHRDPEDDVTPRRVGPERNTVLREELLVARAIRLRVDEHPWRRRLGDAVSHHEQHVKPNQREEGAGNQKHVHHEEAAEGRASDGVTAEDEACHSLADDRNPPRLLGADDHRPGRVLIPAQELPGKPHSERHREEENAREPVHLAREFVGPGEEHLPHVDTHHQHHRRGPIEVEPAKHASERGLVGDEEERLVRLRRRGDVRKGERDAAQHLDDEGEERRAPEHVPPARPARHRVIEDRLEHRGDADSIVDRVPCRLEEPFEHHQPMGMGSVRISTSPPRTRTG